MQSELTGAKSGDEILIRGVHHTNLQSIISCAYCSSQKCGIEGLKIMIEEIPSVSPWIPYVNVRLSFDLEGSRVPAEFRREIEGLAGELDPLSPSNSKTRSYPNTPFIGDTNNKAARSVRQQRTSWFGRLILAIGAFIETLIQPSK